MISAKLDDCRGAVVIPLAEAPNQRDPVELKDEEVAKFGDVNPVYLALKEVYGVHLGRPYLSAGAIVIPLTSKDAASNFGAADLGASLMRSAQEIRANAQRAEPLPLRAAVSYPGATKVLKALAVGSRKTGVRLLVRDGTTEHDVPVLDSSDFVVGASPDERQQIGTYPIFGLVHNWEKKQIELLLTGNLMSVILPEDASWSWEAVRHALDQPTYYVGGITRHGGAGPWQVMPGARLVAQQCLGDRSGVEVVAEG